ncbi:class I SAM-dependent methyltransferase [Ideonella sp. YS5]|uniref:class I SAM-dependent methyltransferase n=1 Tax=Ideonella sp. YS5 TaxID=3453714 RepID=UPI003EEBCFA5
MTSPSTTFISHSGEDYERMMGRWSRRLAPLLIDFAGLGEGERVLDVGCGTGSLANALAATGLPAEIQAIDLSAPYIEQARRRNQDPRITFSLGDACDVPFPAASFDRVLSLLVLHFVPEPQRAIAQMRRVARPGAVVAAATWDARGGLVANRMFLDTAAMLDPQAGELRQRSFTRPMTRPGELGGAWRDGGLVDVAETALAIRMEFDDFADYWRPFEGRDGPPAQYVATLATEPREKLREAVRAAYLDGEPDGPRSYAAIAWAVRGRVPG